MKYSYRALIFTSTSHPTPSDKVWAAAAAVWRSPAGVLLARSDSVRLCPLALGICGIQKAHTADGKRINSKEFRPRAGGPGQGARLRPVHLSSAPAGPAADTTPGKAYKLLGLWSEARLNSQLSLSESAEYYLNFSGVWASTTRILLCSPECQRPTRIATF